MRERLDEHLGGARADVRRVGPRRRARLEERAVGQPVLAAPGGRVEVERRVVGRRLLVGLGPKQRRRLRRERAWRDDVRVRLHAVDRHGRRPWQAPRRGLDPVGGRLGIAPVGPLDALDRAPGGAARLPDGVPRASQQRARRGARDEQEPGEDQRNADDQRPRLADHVCEAAPERRADGAAVALPQGDHQPEEADREAGAERPQVDQFAANEHQAADADERERDERRGGAEAVVQPVGDVRPDGASVEAEPQHGSEDEPERDEAEPPELGMVVPARLLRLLADAGRAPGLARPRRHSPLLPRGHGLAGSAQTQGLLRRRVLRADGL